MVAASTILRQPPVRYSAYDGLDEGGIMSPHAARLVVALVLIVSLAALASCGGTTVITITAPPTIASSPGVTETPATSPTPADTSSPSPSPADTVVSPSPSATDTSVPSPSPSESSSPSATPTVASESQQFSDFVHAVRPIRLRYRLLENRLEHIIWTDAHKYIDSSWPPAGHNVWRAVNNCDAILVDLQLVQTPDFMQSGMSSLLKCLRLERKMYTQIGNWLVWKQSWASGTTNGKRYEALLTQSGDAADLWRIKVKMEAKRLGVHIPWNWSKP
jgi:hypothetical protein